MRLTLLEVIQNRVTFGSALRLKPNERTRIGKSATPMTRIASNSNGLNVETVGDEDHPETGIQRTFGSNSGPSWNGEVKTRGCAGEGPWTKAP